MPFKVIAFTDDECGKCFTVRKLRNIVHVYYLLNNSLIALKGKEDEIE